MSSADSSHAATFDDWVSRRRVGPGRSVDIHSPQFALAAGSSPYEKAHALGQTCSPSIWGAGLKLAFTKGAQQAKQSAGFRCVSQWGFRALQHPVMS